MKAVPPVETTNQLVIIFDQRFGFGIAVNITNITSGIVIFHSRVFNLFTDFVGLLQ